MPSAAASPSGRETIAVRATITKLGPGLMAPTAIAPAIPSRESVLFIGFCLAVLLRMAEVRAQMHVHRRLKIKL